MPGLDVLGAKAAVGRKRSGVVTRVTAGEDARARVCVRDATLVVGPARCRAVTVTGLRSSNVELRPPAGTLGPVEIAVQFAAESNRARRTLLLRWATVRP